MNTHVYPNVFLGEGHSIGFCVVLGEPPRGFAPGSIETHIGPEAVIRSHTVIYAGNKIGSNFQTGHQVMVREENKIGNNVSIGTGSVVEHHTTIEDNVRIHSQVFIPEYSILKKGCWLGPNVVLTNAKYPNRRDTKENLTGVVIEENAVIGANVTILPGLTIGRGAIIGAGSVVTANISEGMVVYGNPAGVQGKASHIGY